MDYPFTKKMLINGIDLQNDLLKLEYQNEVNKFVKQLVELISFEVIKVLNPKFNNVKKYTYFFENHSIQNHPILPYIITKDKTHFYKNDYINIYPVKELIEELKIKFPDSQVKINDNKTGIIIDWS
jgi:hypothetical protein